MADMTLEQVRNELREYAGLNATRVMERSRWADAIDSALKAQSEHCMCPACRQGVIHDSGCAVHNEPAMPVGACDCSIRPSIDSALKAQGEPVAEICSDGEPLLYAGKRRPEGTKLYTAPPADDRPTWDEVRRMLVLAVDWGYDEGFAYANDGCAQAVPIDEKCDRIITEFRKEKEK